MNRPWEKGKGNEKKKIETFEDLRVWLSSDRPSQVKILNHFDTAIKESDFALKDQLRRASVLIPINISPMP